MRSGESIEKRLFNNHYYIRSYCLYNRELIVYRIINHLFFTPPPPPKYPKVEISEKMRHAMKVLKKDPFYSGTGYEDYYRMPLIKPYEMDALSRWFDFPGVSRAKDTIIPNINKYAVYNKFFIAKIKPDTDEADRSIFDGYLIVDLRNKNIPSLTRSGEINYEYNSFSERAKYLKHPAI